MAELTIFYTVLLIFIGIILIVCGSLGVNLYNRTKSSADNVAKNEDIFFIVTITIGILTLLVPVIVFIYRQSSKAATVTS